MPQHDFQGVPPFAHAPCFRLYGVEISKLPGLPPFSAVAMANAARWHRVTDSFPDSSCSQLRPPQSCMSSSPLCTPSLQVTVLPPFWQLVGGCCTLVPDCNWRRPNAEVGADVGIMTTDRVSLYFMTHSAVGDFKHCIMESNVVMLELVSSTDTDIETPGSACGGGAGGAGAPTQDAPTANLGVYRW